ncbi:hypothetical protein BDQ17DRAFT_1439549 [Cyathus striatus]|nr:hypothetical protein BDQ17DRAFT_1439549 [Cyathus striatus]
MDIQDQWESIKTLAEETYTGKTMSELSVIMDYTQHPSTTQIEPRDLATQIAATYIPDAFVVQCLLLIGSNQASITLAGDINDLELEGMAWFAGRALISYCTLEPIEISDSESY